MLHSRLGNTAQRLLRGFQQQPLTLVRLLGTAAILAHYAVAKYTLVHPFLVSDNRCVAPPAVTHGCGRAAVDAVLLIWLGAGSLSILTR